MEMIRIRSIRGGIAGITLCGSCFFLILCGGRETVVERGNKTATLHLGNGTEPADLDPHIVTGIPEYNIISACIEGLVGEDPQDLHPVPTAAALSWETSDNGLTYIFHLRHNATWSNGEPVTADDFVFSFQRILSPALGSEYAYMLYCMKNAESFHTGALEDFSRVGVAARDSFTLEIELAAPTPYFLSLLVHHSWYPVHPATILSFGPIDKRGTRWTRPEHFVGNGPYTLSEWRVGERVVVTRRNDYWDAGNVRVKAIHFHPVESNQTEERMFRSGGLHVTNSVPLNKIDVYKHDSSGLLRISPYLGTYFYNINIARPPLNDSRIRRALAMALDRQSIVADILKGGQLPAYHFTPPGTGGYTSTSRMNEDIESARALLAEAGYPGGRGFPHFEILYNTSESHQIIAQAIQQMWKKNLGIDVVLVNQEWKVYLENQKTRNYDIARMGWIGDYVDPNTFLDMWVTGGGNNRTGWSNTIYDSLIREAGKTGTTAERFSLFQQAEKILLREMPVIPIYFYTSVALVRPEVKGWYSNILNHHPYKHVYLDP